MLESSYYHCVPSGYHDYMAKVWAKRKEDKGTFEEMCEKIWERHPDTIICDKQGKEHRYESIG